MLFNTNWHQFPEKLSTVIIFILCTFYMFIDSVWMDGSINLFPCIVRMLWIRLYLSSRHTSRNIFDLLYALWLWNFEMKFWFISWKFKSFYFITTFNQSQNLLCRCESISNFEHQRARFKSSPRTPVSSSIIPALNLPAIE